MSFYLGFFSIVSQIILLRELLIVFYGNEMSYAVIFASWLFWIAVGSFVVSLLRSKINPMRLIALIRWGLFFILPFTITAARSIKFFMNISPGQIVDMVYTSLCVFILIAPLTFLFGGLFTSICFVYESERKEDEKMFGIGSIYLWESFGGFIGGIFFSFIAIHLLSSMQIVFLLSAVNLVIFLDKRKWFFSAEFFFCVLVALALVSGFISKIDNLTRKVQWRGFNLIAVADSIYGNIAVIKDKEEYSLFENGSHSATTRDELTNEEAVHFALLECIAPKNVLLIGGGLTGTLDEILKYKEVSIDYVEIDSKLIEIARKYFTKENLQGLNNPPTRIINSDGRLFVKKAQNKYDVVIINLPDPNNGLINRYYTFEFFKEVNRILNTGGIFSLKVSSSENYLNEEAKLLLRSINTTLKKVFADVKSVPGDTNIFLSSNASNVITLEPKILVQRLRDWKINTKYVREYYLPDKLSEDRISYIENVLKVDGALNTDSRPAVYLYDIILWSTHFNTGFKNLIARIQLIKEWHLFIIPLFILILGLLIKKANPSFLINLSISSTGFSEIIFQIIIIMAFQFLYGYAYYKIGIIVSMFMLGLVLGSLLARKFIASARDRLFLVYKTAQLGIFLYAVILPVVFVYFSEGVFLALPIIAGILGGLQYPLAVKLKSIYNPQRKGEAPGFIYALDVFGSSIGALITGAFLIPLFGIATVCYLCAGINFAVLLLLCLVKEK